MSRRLKPFSYKQETETQKNIFQWGEPHKVLLSFNLPSSLMLLNTEDNRYWTRKRITFGMERLIVNEMIEKYVPDKEDYKNQQEQQSEVEIGNLPKK